MLYDFTFKYLNEGIFNQQNFDSVFGFAGKCVRFK